MDQFHQVSYSISVFLSVMYPTHMFFSPLGFSLNLVLKLWVHLKFMYETPNWTAPNRNTLNQTMWSQTKACITKSNEICAVLGYYAAENGNPLLTFWHHPLVPSSKIKKKQKRKQNMTEVNWHYLVLGPCPLSNFLKKHSILEAISVSVFRQRNT